MIGQVTVNMFRRFHAYLLQRTVSGAGLWESRSILLRRRQDKGISAPFLSDVSQDKWKERQNEIRVQEEWLPHRLSYGIWRLKVEEGGQ